MQRACAVLGYTVIRDLSGSTKFFSPHCAINGKIFGEKLSNIKCVFGFSLQILPQTDLIQTIIMRDIKKCTYIGLHGRTGYSCHILKKMEFSRQIF
jgi:hypothetical protein